MLLGPTYPQPVYYPPWEQLRMEYNFQLCGVTNMKDFTDPFYHYFDVHFWSDPPWPDPFIGTWNYEAQRYASYQTGRAYWGGLIDDWSENRPGIDMTTIILAVFISAAAIFGYHVRLKKSERGIVFKWGFGKGEE